MPDSTDSKDVTICIPTFNAESTLAETIQSILNQSYTQFKLLIVDNASTDNTAGLVDKFAAQDSRVRFIGHDTNVGGEGNFTRCLRFAVGDYAAIFHADDIYTSEMVAKQVGALNDDHEIAAVFTRGQMINDLGEIYDEHPCPEELFSKYAGKIDLAATLSLLVKWGNFFICPSAMVRTEIYCHIGEWDRGYFASSSDLDMWLRILQDHQVAILNEPLIHYRSSTASFSYHYGFLRTRRSDFYLVMDEYLYNINKDVVNRADLFNYEFQNFKENVGLAFNSLMSSEPKQMREFLIPVFTRSNVLTALQHISWLKFLALGCAIRVLSLFPLPEKLRQYLTQLRYGR